MVMATDGGKSKLAMVGLTSQSKWFLFFKCALLVWLALFVVDMLILYIQPRLYEGRVRLQIMANSQPFEVFRDNSILTGKFAHTALQDEAQIVTSKETLYDLIEELQLVKRWDDAKSPSDAYGLLLGKMSAELLPGTSLLDIQIHHTDPQEAADLANATAQAYKRRRMVTETSRATNALDMLNAQETLQEQKVEDARQRMIELMEKFDIVDLGNDSQFSNEPDRIPTTTTQLLIDEQKAFQQKKREASDLKARVETVQGIDKAQRTQWLLHANLLPDAARKAHSDAMEREKGMALILASGMVAESSSEVTNLEKEIKALKQFVQSAGAEALKLMVLEEKLANAALENHSKIVERLRNTILQERKSYVQYAEAKRAYQTQNRILSEMREQLLKQKVDLSLPSVQIEIHEIAEANEVPVSPDIPETFADNALYNFLWCIPGGLIVMYFAMLYTAKSERYELEAEEIPEAVEVEVEDELEAAEKEEETW